MNKWLRRDTMLFAFCVALFVFFPQIDYSITTLFYDPMAAGTNPFIWADVFWVQGLYRTFAVLQWPILLILSAVYTFNRVRNSGQHADSVRSKVLFLLVLLLLGPGLAVNEVVKKTSGRERPNDTQMFGGSAQHQDFLDFSGACKSNCSFVSGHAALGFWFIGLAWVTGRRRYFQLGIAIGLLVGLGRVMQGNHYASDVVFAFWIVYWLALPLARWRRLSPPR